MSIRHEVQIKKLREEMDAVLATLEDIKGRLAAQPKQPKKAENGTKR